MRLADALQLAANGGDSPSTVNPTTGHGPEWGEAAPIGLLVIVLMCVALYFLIKSMNRNLKKVPSSFDGTLPNDDVSGREAVQASGVMPDAASPPSKDPGGSVSASSPSSGSIPPPTSTS